MKIANKVKCSFCQRDLTKDKVGILQNDYCFCKPCLNVVIREFRYDIADYIKRTRKEKEQRLAVINSNAVRAELKK